MEKLNLPFFYQLGAQLSPLTEFIPDDNNRAAIYLAAYLAKGPIAELMTSKSFATLTVCRAAGGQFLNAIVDVQKWISETPIDKFRAKDTEADTKFEILINKAKEFETILLAELQTLGTYHVTQKGIYSTAGLVDNTENMLPDSIRLKVEQNVVDELRQSGRCLAFDVPTASGFHILRATEIVLHEYYLDVRKPENKERLENWGAYIASLQKSNDPNVKETVALLQQIKDNDRNLIMHPERILSSDDAFILFEIAKSAIMAMSVKLASPINIIPTYGATSMDVNPTFNWSAVTGTISYEFEIAEELGQTDKFNLKDEVGISNVNTFKLVDTLKYNTKYWWRVRAVKHDGAKSDWITSFFTTKTQPIVSKQP
jgi:hypothetical protein